jgi:hypothetical protein
MMGGALGLAILASLAAARTDTLRASGSDALTALNGGYHAAFLAGAIFAFAAAVVSALLLRPSTTQVVDHIDARPADVAPVHVSISDF